MGTIAFVLDFEPGHFFPAFGLGHALVARDHRVTYLSAPDIGSHVVRQGFEFKPIFKESYPPGALSRIQETGGGGSRNPFESHLLPMIQGALDATLKELQPDVVVVSSFLALEALILLYRSGPQLVVLTENLRAPEKTPAAIAGQRLLDLNEAAFELLELAIQKGAKMRSLPDLVKPLHNVPEFVACPPEFDLPNIDRGPFAKYLGPCLRQPEETESEDFPWSEIPEDKRLVYIAMGSQAYPRRAEKIYKTVLELFQIAGDDLHFILALPRGIEAEKFSAASPHVTVSSWVPQMKILQRAALFVTHAGLGSVKESIFYGVPMVAIPIARDQPDNAERIQHHRLGACLSVDHLTSASLRTAIESVLNDTTIAESVKRMSVIFREREAKQDGVRWIEERMGRFA